MGCIYACICGGLCISCHEYKPETYFGEAEDIASQSRGYKDMDDEINRKKLKNNITNGNEN
jgi:hypothetical protein